MSKLQFWTLNLVSVVLIALIAGHFLFVRHNSRLGEALERDSAAINQARQVETVLDQLAKRIAAGSEYDPRLKNILVKYGLSVTLDVDGKKKTYP